MFSKKSKIVRKKKNIVMRALLSHKQEIIGVFLVAIAIFLTLSFISFDPSDNSWVYFASNTKEVSNWCGTLGANVASVFFYLFGSAAYLVLATLIYVSFILLFKFSIRQNLDRIVASLLFTLSATTLLKVHNLDFTKSYPGGFIGYYIHDKLLSFLGVGGVLILLYSLVWISAVLMRRISLFKSLLSLCNFFVVGLGDLLGGVKVVYLFLFKNLRKYSSLALNRFSKNKDVYVPQSPVTRKAEVSKHEEPQEASMQGALTVLLEDAKKHVDKTVFIEGRYVEILKKECLLIRNSIFLKNLFSLADDILALDARKMRGASLYNLPDLSLFNSNEQQSKARELLEEECNKRAEKLEEKLCHFGIEGQVTAILPGPVVTLFEYTPEIGTKISKIIALEDDLAMVLKALSIRIIAPIPGRSVVGFEIPNKNRENVLLSDILLNDSFEETKGTLPLALGVDIVGNPVIEDLFKMPHLLVAGSTGSGKSVGLNAMLVSLLCRLRPDEMKLILIDPKRLEFASYKDIPHLLFPIVADPRKVPVVLKWLVTEMERRYEKMAETGARNLLDYKKLYKQDESLEDLPFIVLIIDELADLMMVAGKEVETYIARIAQMARAAGIHMIVATQRPSVDVLTGLIKVNFPSRISFKVTSKVDSKTILDVIGAEKLLGRGDMLCTDPRSSELRRLHGAFVSDEEINKLVEHLKKQGKTNYLDLDEIVLKQSHGESSFEDELYGDVVEFVRTIDEISISMLQRKYRIGFNRSARLIEKLELSGVIAPAQGGKPRKVIR